MQHTRECCHYKAANGEVSEQIETQIEKDYAKAVTALNAYFQAKENKTDEIYMFINANRVPINLLISTANGLRE